MGDEEKVPPRLADIIWIPLSVWDDMTVPWLAKSIFMQIHSYKENGRECFISNKHIAEKFNISVTRASNIVSILLEKGWIEQVGFDGRKRYLQSCMEVRFKPALNKSVRQGSDFVQGSIEQKFNHTNNKLLNKTTKVKVTKAFQPPTLVEMEIYFIEKGSTRQQAKAAFDHYDAADWHDSYGSPVKNWKQKCLTNWINKNYDTKKTTAAQRPRGYTDEELFAPFNEE